jgi:HK97 family phage portal protein
VTIRDFLDKFITKKTKIGGTVTIEISEDIYYLELALYTAASLIGNAVAKCEIKTYQNGEEVKGEDYFTLNYSPNPNENASKFWHKVIGKMIRERMALVVEEGGKLFCADSWNIKNESVLYGNTYENVTVGNFTFKKIFKANEVYLFEMDNEEVYTIICGVYKSFGSVLGSAVKGYKRSNGQKFKLKMPDIKEGDEEFNEVFEEVIKKNLKDFMENENAVYPEYEGYQLERSQETSYNTKASDIISVKNDFFDTVGKALKIPQSLMTGNVNNTKEVMKAFLTFGVDPVADMIGETLTKRGGFGNFKKGNYYKVCTNKINHIDLFDIAPNVDKLISSGGFSIDEVRKEADYPEKGEGWSMKHWITKNYETIERLMKGVEGGEKE